MRVSMSPRIASLDLPVHCADQTVPRERWNVSQSAPCTHALCAQANGIRSLNKQLTGLQGVLLIDETHSNKKIRSWFRMRPAKSSLQRMRQRTRLPYGPCSVTLLLTALARIAAKDLGVLKDKLRRLRIRPDAVLP